MALTAAPTAPDIADQSTFQARSQAWVIYIKDVLIPELNAIIGATIPAGSAAAGTLTGDTLAANVLASSLTSLGVQTELSVSGNVSLGNNAADLLNVVTNAMNVSAAGELTYPLQPAFNAIPSGALLNVTGDSTVYDVVCATEFADQNADFGGSAYTASKTGLHDLSGAVNLSSILSGHTLLYLYINTSNRAYPIFRGNPYVLQDSSGILQLSGSVSHADMDAGDIATLRLLISGSTKTVDIDVSSWFTGGLRC